MLYTNHNTISRFHNCLHEQYGRKFKNFQYLASEGTTAHYRATHRQFNEIHLFKLTYLDYEEFCMCYVYKVKIQKSKYQLEDLEDD